MLKTKDHLGLISATSQYLQFIPQYCISIPVRNNLAYSNFTFTAQPIAPHQHLEYFLSQLWTALTKVGRLFPLSLPSSLSLSFLLFPSIPLTPFISPPSPSPDNIFIHFKHGIKKLPTKKQMAEKTASEVRP